MSSSIDFGCRKRSRDASETLVSLLSHEWASSVRERLEILHQRLVRNGSWNIGEKLEVEELVHTLMRQLANESNVETKSLEDFAQQISTATSNCKQCFGAVTSTMIKDEPEAVDQLQDLCKSIDVEHENCSQDAVDIVDLYNKAALTRSLFNQHLIDVAQGLGLPVRWPNSLACSPEAIGLQLAHVKTLVRAVEKLAVRSTALPWQCGEACDIVRASFIVESVAQGNAVLRALRASDGFRIVSVRQRLTRTNASGWADVRVLVRVASDIGQHVCEVRIVYKRMASIAESIGGREAYVRFRVLQEHVQFVSSACKRSKLGLPSLRTSMIDSSRNGDALNGMLAHYPHIPLSEYRADGHHLPINVNYPKLRAIHRDPWIFLVPDILSRDECEKLMIKAGTRMTSSDRFAPRGGNAHRTSSECRIAKDETRGIQSRYCELLGVPVDNLEAAKVSCYRKGQYFKNHVDPLSGTQFLENRIATLFIYLNTCQSGGETRFLSLPSKRTLDYVVGEKVAAVVPGEGDFPGVIEFLHSDGSANIRFDDGDVREHVARSELRAYETLAVKPMQGLGVLFFPAYLPTSPLALQSEKQVDRYLLHDSNVAVDEKWVHQQWVWPSCPQAHCDGLSTNGTLL